MNETPDWILLLYLLLFLIFTSGISMLLDVKGNPLWSLSNRVSPVLSLNSLS